MGYEQDKNHGGTAQRPLQGSVVALGRQRRGQAGQLGAGHIVGDGGGGDVDDAGNFPLGAAVLEMQPPDFVDFAHG